MRRFTFFTSWLDLVLVCATLVTTGYAKIVPFLEPGFFFDYNIGTPPIPVTEQCETIHLKWGRQGAIGANPVAPYSFTVYTSISTTPITIAAGSGLSFDWTVPFAPGTQYQICMWDKNGLSGGCQSTYTVVRNTTVVDTPTCQNVTFPRALDVDARVPSGPMSQFGFIDQCTDLSVRPKAGKPPFILTVAPALHPPYNITSNTMDPIVWTVSLSRAFPFFLSMASADGLLWSNGPQHAGGFGPTDCLAPGTIPQSKATTLALAAGLGGSLGVAIVALLLAFLFLRYRRRKENIRPFPLQMAYKHDSGTSAGNQGFTASSPDSYRPPARMRQNTDVAAFPPGQNRTNSFSSISRLSEPPNFSTGQTDYSAPSRSRTYVLHHDAGQAPVTVITPEETDIVELPPRYQNTNGLPQRPEKGGVRPSNSNSNWAGPSTWEGPSV